MTELHDNDYHLIKGREIVFITFGGEELLIIVPELCPIDRYSCRQVMLAKTTDDIELNKDDSCTCPNHCNYIEHTIYCNKALKSQDGAYVDFNELMAHYNPND